MGQTFVDPTSRKKPKFVRLAQELGIDRMHAWGLATGLWCFCWEQKIYDAVLRGWSAQAIADELYWKGDAEKLMEAFLRAGVICGPACRHGEQPELTVHDWILQQGRWVKKLQADRRYRQDKADKERGLNGKQEIGVDGEIERQILQAMSQSKITGTAAQKREHIQAWRARGLKGADILQLVANNPGKDIFELKKLIEKRSHRNALQAIDDLVKEPQEVPDGDEPPTGD